jgi:transposase
MRKSKDQKWIRYEIVRYAHRYGIKPAARAFNTTVKTVRKWYRRWEPGSMKGLEDRRGDHPQKVSKIDPEQKRKTVKLKKKLKSWGAVRIKREFDLTISEKAILKIWKEEGLMKKKRRKHKTKNDLRAVKAKWRLFEQIDVDTKALFDIPEYWEQMRKHNLPRYQYTARDVVSGLQFLGFAEECTLTYATLFAQTIIEHLQKCGVDLHGCRLQTDNGSEFIGAWNAYEPSLFTKTVESVNGFKHHTIPPAAHTYQADVETVHAIIEDEFYEIESFSSKYNFFAKATAYITFFNVARKNSYKNYKTPWEIISERNNNIKPHVAILPAINLQLILKLKFDNLSLRGYDCIPQPSIPLIAAQEFR